MVFVRQTLAPGYERTLLGLLGILGGVLLISNYLLEDICFYELRLLTFPLPPLMCVLRFASETPTTLPMFEQALLRPFTIIIQ